MWHEWVDGSAYWVVRATAWVIQRLPLSLVLAFGKAAGTFAYFFNKRRRIAYVNLKSAFPGSTLSEKRSWIREAFQNLAMNGIEVMRFPVMDELYAKRFVKHHNYDIYLKHQQGKKGVILLTAHLGNWELSQAVEGMRGRPMTVLARRQKYRRLDGLLNSFREHHGSVSIGRGAGIRDVIQGLRAGGCVGILADQSGGDDGIWLKFFGHWAGIP
jgi:KDO2-lipid IV(A) lauroyltransferase